MTHEETKEILGTLRTAFPNAYRDIGREEANAIFSLWCAELESEDFKKVKSAVSALIGTKTASYTPSIGDIKREVERQFPQGSWALNRRPYPQSFLDSVHRFLKEEGHGQERI